MSLGFLGQHLIFLFNFFLDDFLENVQGLVVSTQLHVLHELDHDSPEGGGGGVSQELEDLHLGHPGVAVAVLV